MASGGKEDIAKFCNLKPFFPSINSTSLIELDPISIPMTFFFFPQFISYLF
jgi:hypothetical protein